MKIRVVRATEQCWYSGMVGEIFYVFVIENIIWFSNSLFFYSEDIEVVKTKEEGWLPVFLK